MNQRLLLCILVLCLCSPAIIAQGSQHSKPSVGDENTPNTKSDQHQKSTKDVSDRLQKDLDSKNAAYAGSNIRAGVDDQTIMLTGTVASQSQYEMAMQLAKAYAGNRQITDRLVIQQ